jgi:hypothetical protein
MLLFHMESWGRIVFDPEGDEFWVEVTEETKATRIDHPLSVTCRLNESDGQKSSAESPISAGLYAWLSSFQALREIGVLRFNLEGMASIPKSDALDVVRKLHGWGLGVVISAPDCTPDLERFPGFPAGVGLQVFFDPHRVYRSDRSGDLSLARRIEILHQCVAAELRVRVLTPYPPPASPIALTEVGAELAAAGVRDWLILTPTPTEAQSVIPSEAILEEIRRLRQDIPWLEVRLGSFRQRELEFIVHPHGRVSAQEVPGNRRPLLGTLDQLVDGQLLTKAFLDRHVDLWVSGILPPDGGGGLGVVPPVPTNAPGRPNLHPEVFISYNRKDLDLVRSLRDDLESADIKTWLDTQNLELGERWRPGIQKALKESPFVMICVGPSGLGQVQELEIEFVLNRAVRDNVKIIPVLLPGAEDEPGIFEWLRAWQIIDFRRSDPDLFQSLVRAIRYREPPSSEEGRTTSGPITPP